jgi:hypothetical protein
LTPDAPELYKQVGVMRGRQKSPGCSGSISVTSPVCDEVVAPEDFQVSWSPVPGERGHVQVEVKVLDGPHSNDQEASVDADFEAGLGDQKKLQDYLASVQGEDADYRIQIHVGRSSALTSVVTVSLASKSKVKSVKDKAAQFGATDTALRAVTDVVLSIQQHMWTRAARAADTIESVSPHEPQLAPFLLAGYCFSGNQRRRAEFRQAVIEAGFVDGCPAESPTSPSDQSLPPSRGSRPSGRLGVALLIGNYKYPNDTLDGVEEDLVGMEKTLVRLGFEVRTLKNLTRQEEFKEAIESFLNQTSSNADDVALVYFSGHGVQLDGQSYLLGTGFSPASDPTTACLLNGMKLDEVVSMLQRSPLRGRVVIYDACRTNVFTAASDRDVPGGVSLQREKRNTVIMFANKPGAGVATAQPGGLRSPFTEALIFALNGEGMGVREIFSLAQAKTSELSPGQVPELRLSDEVDADLLKKKPGLADDDGRSQEMISKSCEAYRGHDWEKYLTLAPVAAALTRDQALSRRLKQEIDFVQHVQQAEGARRSGDISAALDQWATAAEIFPGRAWVRMELALSELLADKPQLAGAQLSTLEGSDDPGLAASARRLRQALNQNMPNLVVGADPIGSLRGEDSECSTAK